MTVLGLLQQRPRIRRELSRRIGYTNGLHDISRFARVSSYLHGMAPAPTASLRGAILDAEKVKGSKYADGVIDVARALGLVHKSGATLTLSDNGSALHAIQHLEPSPQAARALLLHSVLEFDGDATLNLLDILAAADPGPTIGELLVARLLRILELRADWIQRNIETKSVKDFVMQELTESIRRLELAVDLDRKQAASWSTFKKVTKLSAEERLQRFHAHTVNPRKGWLKDLLCIEEHEHRNYVVTKSGHRLLASFRDASCYTEGLFLLPFSMEVSALLGVPDPEETKDLYWKATASSFGTPSVALPLSPDELFQFVQQVYPLVKFPLFNEAAIDSVFVVFAALSAKNAHYVMRDIFNDTLDATITKYSGQLYRLRQRHGATGYIALKSTVD